MPNAAYRHSFYKGLIAGLPLSLAVLPWGILAGSLAIEVGLRVSEAIAMSALVFAGAVQLAVLGMLTSGAGLLSILLTSFMISSRHLLYGMAMRPHIAQLSLPWRLSLGFLLTDEMFVLASPKGGQFDRWFALGAGLGFYLSWNLWTLLGIVIGQQLNDLESWGLDFVIAATFIALLIPAIKNSSSLLAALIAALLSVLFSWLQLPGALLLAALIAMALAYLLSPLIDQQASSLVQSEQQADD
ncbi:AzlC family ABC transporter permease [Dasania sp. GY-MA-18]|uniref:AzlC family ABC transporter permease n=1 Tax=Dasania phycosphaerae TaxID=2950436 RepID=A0A9J6RMZ3_9GAMM|nr:MULTISPECIES: AzlC family ABC transporter permease [Dasania]MCR8923466.1 AzlC family ABC transporter permease [Dasania sp. GY-MA-18]MCZ0865899.1 AzlC family ABC transporter permease [Dasania phycosphaerae]MCZ0869623.1 AzlC family ABC transporter permease [Dasania phycosphaerae]